MAVGRAGPAIVRRCPKAAGRSVFSEQIHDPGECRVGPANAIRDQSDSAVREEYVPEQAEPIAPAAAIEAPAVRAAAVIISRGDEFEQDSIAVSAVETLVFVRRQ